jgi:hypothetical protein
MKNSIKQITAIILMFALVVGCFAAMPLQANAEAKMPRITNTVHDKVLGGFGSYVSVRDFTATGRSISGNDYAVGLWQCAQADGKVDVYILATNVNSKAAARIAQLDGKNGEILWSVIETVDGATVLYSLIKFPDTPKLTGGESLYIAMGNGNGHLITGTLSQFFIFETYHIEYYYDNEIDNSLTKQITNPVEVGTKIQHSDYEQRSKPGYKFESDNTPFEITDMVTNNVIRVYYVKDSFDVRVEYYLDSVTGTPFKTDALGKKEFDSKVALSQADKEKYLTVNEARGYKYSSISADPLIVNVDGNVIKVLYVKDSFDVTVEYYLDSSGVAFKTDNLGRKEFGSRVFLSQEAKEKYLVDAKGYKYDSISAEPLIVNVNGNVIRVYYVKASFGYEVRYYKDTLDEMNYIDSVSGAGLFGSAIPVDAARFAPVGYVKPGSVSGQMVVTEISAGNVVKVLYVKDTFTYVVRYYKGDVLFENSAPLSATFLDIISEYAAPDGDLTGYTWSSDDGPLTISADDSENVLNVYYERIQYSVTFLPGNSKAADFDEKSYSAYYGDIPDAPHPYAKFGWKFLGWFDGTKLWAPEDYHHPGNVYLPEVTGDVTYTAMWESPAIAFPDKIPSVEHFDRWWADYGILCFAASSTKEEVYTIMFADWFFDAYKSVTIGFGTPGKMQYEIVFEAPGTNIDGNDITLWQITGNSEKEIKNPGITYEKLPPRNSPGHYSNDPAMYESMQGATFANPFGNGAKQAWLY